MTRILGGRQGMDTTVRRSCPYSCCARLREFVSGLLIPSPNCGTVQYSAFPMFSDKTRPRLLYGPLFLQEQYPSNASQTQPTPILGSKSQCNNGGSWRRRLVRCIKGRDSRINCNSNFSRKLGKWNRYKETSESTPTFMSFLHFLQPEGMVYFLPRLHLLFASIPSRRPLSPGYTASVWCKTMPPIFMCAVRTLTPSLGPLEHKDLPSVT